MRLVPRLRHRTAEPMRSCLTTARTVRHSILRSIGWNKFHSRAEAKHCTVDPRHRSVQASHPDNPYTGRSAKPAGLISDKTRALF